MRGGLPGASNAEMDQGDPRHRRPHPPPSPPSTQRVPKLSCREGLGLLGLPRTAAAPPARAPGLERHLRIRLLLFFVPVIEVYLWF